MSPTVLEKQGSHAPKLHCQLTEASNSVLLIVVSPTHSSVYGPWASTTMDLLTDGWIQNEVSNEKTYLIFAYSNAKKEIQRSPLFFLKSCWCVTFSCIVELKQRIGKGKNRAIYLLFLFRPLNKSPSCETLTFQVLLQLSSFSLHPYHWMQAPRNRKLELANRIPTSYLLLSYDPTHLLHWGQLILPWAQMCSLD